METSPANIRPRKRRRVVRRRDPLAGFPAPLRAWLAETLVPAWRTISAPPVLILLVLALPILLVAFQFQATRRIDVGAGNDSFYLRGTFAQEQGDGTDFRWTRDSSAIIVPGVPGNSTWTASLRISNGRPPGGDTPEIRVLADGREAGRFTIVPGFQDYRFQFRRPPLADEDLRLTIESQTFDPPGDADNRQLGVVLDAITISPARDRAGAPYLYPPAYALAALALFVGLAGLLGYLGTPTLGAAAAIVALLAGLIVGQLRAPDIATGYVFGLLLILATTTVATAILRPLVRRLYARGGVLLTPREERWLGGIFAFGALAHLAGVFFPGFGAHDLVFQTHRVEDILGGNLLLSVISSEWGYQRTPYPPALYMLMAPFAALTRAFFDDTSLPLRLLPPLIDATSPFLIYYLLRRCRLPAPAPLLAAFCYTLVPATYQLLWWGFYSNLFGQWVTLAVLTLTVAHYAELTRPKVFVLLVGLLGLALLSHPGTFVLTVGLIPLLALALAFNHRADRRGAVALVAALALAGAIVYALYYVHFTGLVLGEVRSILAGTRDATGGGNDRGWEDEYIANRLFVLPFALYFVAACITGARLLFAQGRERVLGWLVTAIIATASIFAVIHVATGLWVRYFVFLTPALAIGLGVGLAWLTTRGRWARGIVWLALAYCTASSLIFWFSVTATPSRSPYP
jgi:hypothetical protein